MAAKSEVVTEPFTGANCIAKNDFEPDARNSLSRGHPQ